MKSVDTSAHAAPPAVGNCRTGILILHGLAASRESLAFLAEGIAPLGLPVAVPLLSGHGEPSPEALRGIRWTAWYGDAEKALLEIAQAGKPAIIIGHSMGALLALQLAARHPSLVDSLVLVAPAISLFSLLAPQRPLAFMAPLVGLFVRNWSIQPLFAEPATALSPGTYPWAPTDAILSFFDLIRATMAMMGEVAAPALIIQARRERTVRPESVGILSRRLASAASQQHVVWLEQSDHQVFCDCERSKALAAITEHVRRRCGAH